MTDPIRIIIADDHPLFREGVVHSLAGDPRFDIVGQVSSGEDAINLVKETLPDIILLDITMPGIDGITLTRSISSDVPVTKVVILTASENDDDLVQALKAGAIGYIIKGVSAKELSNIIKVVADGGTYISPIMAQSLLRILGTSPAPDPFSELTERERQILELVTEGLTNREIGERIHLAEKTVKHYMTNILQKLHVRSRVEAAMLALDKGGKEKL